MTEEKIITDRFQRRFPYLRLSVTDICNFSCTYCLPDGYKKTGEGTFLSVDEIRRLVGAFAALGTWKIRLTGGEPTIRPDFLDIARTVSEIPGLRKLAFTTNGYKLSERAHDYYAAGLRAVNVSIDSLDPQKFHAVTGHDRLDEVTDGVQACLDTGFDAVKINTVLMKGINDDALDSFLAFVAERPVSLRFIELMQTGDNLAHFRKHHIPATIVREKLAARGWSPQERKIGAGPAIEYAHSDHQGTIGIIAPYAKDFCATCNRLRVTARGALRLCLFGQGGHDLRPLLQSDDQKQDLMENILSVMAVKPESHDLHRGGTGTTPHLASVGG